MRNLFKTIRRIRLEYSRRRAIYLASRAAELIAESSEYIRVQQRLHLHLRNRIYDINNEIKRL